MPVSGAAPEKVQRNNLDEKMRHRLIEHLLSGSTEGKLGRGDIQDAAKTFKCSRYQVMGVWRRFEQQKTDGVMDINLELPKPSFGGKTSHHPLARATSPTSKRSSRAAIAGWSTSHIVSEMPLSGAAPEKVQRNNLDEKMRHRLIEHLLSGSTLGKLGRGDIHDAAKKFKCSRYQVMGVWRRFEQQKTDGVMDINLCWWTLR